MNFRWIVNKNNKSTTVDGLFKWEAMKERFSNGMEMWWLVQFSDGGFLAVLTLWYGQFLV